MFSPNIAMINNILTWVTSKKASQMAHIQRYYSD